MNTVEKYINGPATGYRPRLLLIDAWNVMIGQNSVANILDSNSQQIGMYLSTMNMIRTFIDKFKPNKVIFAMDGPQAGERRRKLYPGYKAGRRVKAKTSSVSIQYDEDESESFSSSDAFTFQLARIFEFMKHLPVTTCIVPYCEGDDLIAHLALKNKDEYDCYIASGDKDYCQLIDEHVFVYNWRKKFLYTEQTFLEEYKVIPQNYIYMKVMLGDSSDEIKGVKGIGKKTFPIFHEMLSDKENVFPTVKEFVDATKTMDMTEFGTREKNAVKALWSTEVVEEMFLLSRVMRLDESCLKLHHIETLRTQVEEQNSKQCSRILANMVMLKHQFNKLYNGFNNDRWLQPFMFVKPNINIKV